MTGIRLCKRLSEGVNGNELKCQYHIINGSETAVYSICILYYAVVEIDGEKFENSDEILTSRLQSFWIIKIMNEFYERKIVHNQIE